MDAPFVWPGLRKPKRNRVGRAISVETVRAAIDHGDRTLPGSARYRERLRNPRLDAALEELKQQAVAPVDKRDVQATRRRDALVRGITGKEPKGVLAMTLRFVPGGRKTFIGFLERAAINGDPGAQRWMQVYQDLNRLQQDRVSLDHICDAADVTPDEAMATVVSTAMRLGTDAAELTAQVLHPRIVARAAKSALRIGGDHADIAQKDRQWMLEHGKFIAPPRGTSVSVRTNVSAQAAAAAANQPSVPNFRESLSGASGAQRDVQDGFLKRIEGKVIGDEGDVDV